MSEAQRFESTKHTSPTLLIGLGGTGAEVLSRVRDRFFSTIGPLDDYPVIRYLWLDTDTKQATHTTSWYKRHQEIAHQLRFQNHERADLTVQDTEMYLSNLHLHPHIARWIYPHLNSKTSIDQGAGQIRAYGRLAFYHNVGRVKDRLSQAIRAVTSIDGGKRARDNGLVTNPDTLNIILVSSVAGGTGSGTFLDMAYLVRQQLRQLGNTRKVQFFGYLVMPYVFGGPEKMQRLYANGYAALKELNHFNYSPPAEFANNNGMAPRQNGHDYTLYWHPDDAMEQMAVTPFDICYIVDGINTGGMNASGQPHNDTVFSMLADAMVQDFSSSEFAGAMRSNRDNMLQYVVKEAKPLLDVSGTDVRLPCRQFSFGMSSITFPYDRVRRACSAKLGSDVIDYWLRQPDRSTDATEFLRDHFLNGIGMDEVEGSATRQPKHDVLDALYKAGPNNTMLFDVMQRVQEACTHAREMGSDRNGTPWGVFLREALGKLDRDWAGENTTDQNLQGDYVRRMRNNLEEYLRGLEQKLAEEIKQLVDNEDRGIGFALAVLDAFDLHLTRETDGYIDTWENQRKGIGQAVQAARREVEAYLTDLNQQWDMSNWHFLRDVTLQKTLKKLEDAANNLYREQVKAYARTLALQAAQQVRHWISAEEPGGWRHTLDQLQDELLRVKETLDGRARVFAEKQEDFRQVYLYDGPAEMEAIYKEFVPNSRTTAKSFVLKAQAALGDSLLNLRITDLQVTCDKLMRSTEAHFKSLEEKYDALTRFMKKYPPGSEGWNQKLEEMVRACQPWLAWESFAGTRDLTFDGKKGIFMVGVAKNHPRYREFEQAVLDKQSDYQFKIFDTVDRSQIIFFTEVAGFALCQTTSVRPMREQYYKEIAENSKNDLHTDKLDGRFGEIVVLSHQEQSELKAASKAFMVGTLLRVINPQERRDNRNNPFLTYVYKQRGDGLFAQSLYLGVEDTVVPSLRSKKALVAGISDEIQVRYAQLTDWTGYFALLEYYRQEHYPVREVDLGNGATEKLTSTEHRVLLDEQAAIRKMVDDGMIVSHTTWAEFQSEALRRFQEIRTGRAGFVVQNAAKRWVMNLPTLDDEESGGWRVG